MLGETPTDSDSDGPDRGSKHSTQQAAKMEQPQRQGQNQLDGILAGDGELGSRLDVSFYKGQDSRSLVKPGIPGQLNSNRSRA